ncbi:polysaccharide deacetylase family protein [Rhizobium sp. C1]|uniref:polysaccharide deacetylase family protein n=1 Tax=Rhizobium sp. C1 TaxID=1349799 RepID=UPI001E4F9869|nr:polysaccharide deacetylase family protein [Rhizobium sp. C1]MCD2177667.1 polysaccharide deacetylase family protein [Rhizobium sp. C1]
MQIKPLFAVALSCLMLAGCNTTKTEKDGEPSLKSSYAPGADEHRRLKANDPVKMEPTAWIKPGSPARVGSIFSSGGLAGRTLSVGSISDIQLADKELILTFDDGPMPGKTEQILDVLDRFQVKASFMMVGQMARSHPEIARDVVRRGHSIGSHTFSHRNLAALNFETAMAEIDKGQHAVSDAVDAPVGFFRFPYLADTRKIRSALANRGTVVMDVNIDSKDYFKSSPNAVLERTMAVIHHQRKGIILMHDIHARTVSMLPLLLSRLEDEGYKVVTLRYRRSRTPEGGLFASNDH